MVTITNGSPSGSDLFCDVLYVSSGAFCDAGGAGRERAYELVCKLGMGQEIWVRQCRLDACVCDAISWGLS